jgi:phosphoribosylanthranilate isomerase
MRFLPEGGARSADRARERPEPPRIKICGMTTFSEITACAAFGADALGFMVRRTPKGRPVPSSDKIDFAVAKSLIAEVPRL